MSLVTDKTQELTFEDYVQRQSHHVSEDVVFESAAKAKKSSKFIFENKTWHNIPYPGYAIVSLLRNNPGNEILHAKLREIQEEIVFNSGLEEYLFPLPADSFHQTVANTLSADRFLNNVKNAGLEEQYPSIMQEAFDQLPVVQDPAPIVMKIKGLSVFGSSLGVLGSFESKSDYLRIINFREGIYTNSDLNRLDIRRTRPFIGHITLAYFGQELSLEQKEILAEKLVAINLELSELNYNFLISNTELCQYDDLSVFHSSDQYPVYSFIK